MKLKSRYIIRDGSVVEVYIIGDMVAFPAAEAINAEEYEVYRTAQDARYAILLKKLTSGTPLKNYKGSVYYAEYIERLKRENPEFLI